MAVESAAEQEEREKKEGKKQIERIERIRDFDTQLLEKTEWYMEKIKIKVNKNMAKWKLPIRIIKNKAKGNTYYVWAEQKRRPRRREDGVVLKKGRYKYIGVNFTWRRIRGWNKGRIKITGNSKRGWIFTFTAKKISRWNRELQKLYKVRKSVKKVQRDKQRTEKKIRKFVGDMLVALGAEDLKWSVKKEWKFYWVRIADGVEKADLWELSRMLSRIERVVRKQDGKEKQVKKWLKEVSEAKKKIKEVEAERKKIHKRAGTKLWKINDKITAIDKLWYPKPPIRLDLPADLPATENQEGPLEKKQPQPVWG